MSPGILHASAKRAYTLIEVLLVLVLMTSIILIISLALDIHLRQMSINRTDVEEARLARVILDKIAQDIRSFVVAIREEELNVDTETLLTIMGLGGDAGMLADFAPEIADTDELAEDEEEQILYGVQPGIYGGLDWLQIDTAKLPRGEMFGSRQIRRGTAQTSSGMAADRLSASKTVLYYLGQDTGNLTADDPLYLPDRLAGSIGQSLDVNAPQYGLFRRLLDRQATQYAMHEGLDLPPDGSAGGQYDEPMAPEVEWIQFAYFDPTVGSFGSSGDWVDYWDMDERQMLPLAVHIAVGIRRADFGRGLLSFGTAETREPVVYSLVVPIPISIDVSDEEEDWLDIYDYF